MFPVTVSPPRLNLSDSPCGPFGVEYGDALYLFGVASNPDDGSDGKAHCMKSTDGGLTWTEADAGNAPVYRPVGGGQGGLGMTVAFDGATAQLLWTRHDISFVIIGLTRCTFNLTTNLWGSPANIAAPDVDHPYSGGNASSDRGVLLHLVTRAAGDYLLFFSSTHGGTTSARLGRVSCCTYDGATLGTTVVIPSQSAVNTFYLGIGVAFDPISEIEQYVYTSATVGQPQGLVLWTVGRDSGGTFGTPVSIPGTLNDPLRYFVSTPIVFDNDGTLVFAFATEKYNSGFSYSIKLYTSPILLDASWTAANVYTFNDNNTNILTPFRQTFNIIPRVFTLGAIEGLITIGWTCGFFSGPWGFGGATSPTGTFDWTVALLFQCATDIVSYQVASFAAPTLGVGLIGVLEDEADNDNPDTTQFWLFAAPTTPVVLECNSPPAGFVDVAYSHGLLISGGVEPYEITITAGALPVGLAIDDDGLISGTPTVSGTFTFTVLVTDDIDQTDSVVCSIVITNTDCHDPSQIKDSDFVMIQPGIYGFREIV